ncbi:MAG: 50S ribosomal protein L25 [Deltaproteobacteria bacterium]|nr:50S ribosomal protein L25 [Deltaproteobacteria bacterium]
MAIAELAVETRTENGKGYARKLRRTGKIPAVRYGRQCPVSIYAVDRLVMERFLSEGGSSSLVALDVDGAGQNDDLLSIVKDIQRDPVSGRIIHADFYGVRYGEPIIVEVPLVFEGKAAGVLEGGLLQPARRSLEIRCLPRQIPENIVVDVTALGIGDAIHVNDLEAEGVEFTATANFTIVTVQNIIAAEVEAVDEEAVEGEGVEGEEGAEAEAAAE